MRRPTWALASAEQMVPYIHIPDLHVGPIPLHPFGLLVATGVMVGTSVTARRARALGYDLIALNSFVTWMLVSAFVLSHILNELFYRWRDVEADPLVLLQVWNGLSSFGGFVGAVVGVVLWKYYGFTESGRLRKRTRPAPVLPFADLVLSVLPIGWMFGRMGCASVHDHKGARATADTLLAVAFPLSRDDGPVTHFGPVDFIHGHDPRFDLGFLELLFTIVLAACFALTWSRRLPIGTYIIATALAYAPVRFVMDFLRIPESESGDARYGGLTPAQYGCILLFLFGLAAIPYVRGLVLRGGDLAKDVREPPLPDTRDEAVAPS